MNYATIKVCDIANGPGCRISLFVSGCNHRCPGCFNSIAWDFNYGNAFSKDIEDTILNQMTANYIHGLSLLGGEPMDPKNQAGLIDLCKRVKEIPGKSIWCYTGYVYEDLLPNGRAYVPGVTSELLSYIDVLVDGPFIEEKKDISLRFKGSTNQRIIDLNLTMTLGEIFEWNDEKFFNSHECMETL